VLNRALPSVGVVLALAIVSVGSLAAAPIGSSPDCRGVSPGTLAAIGKGLVGHQQIQGPAFASPSGLLTTPWFVAAHVAGVGIGVWITNLPPTGAGAPPHLVIKSADAVGREATRWPGFPGPSIGISNPALASRITAAMLCALK